MIDIWWLEILGVQASPMSVFSVTDKATGNTDGTLTRGKNAEIRGTYIKIAGTNPDNGVYFTDVATGTKTKVEQENMVLNEPSRLMILVPERLAAGTYELSVTTQGSSGASLLKEPRTETLSAPVTVA